MNSTAIDRIAAAVNQLRPDWPVASLRTLLSTKLAGRPWADVAIALTAVAVDPKSQTPARVLEQGPWWGAAQSATGHSEADSHPSHIAVSEWCWSCSKPESSHPWSGCSRWHSAHERIEDLNAEIAGVAQVRAALSAGRSQFRDTTTRQQEAHHVETEA